MPLRSAAVLAASVGAASPPNFVIVLTDDQGFGDTGFECRSNPKRTGHCPKTPNLDDMAAGPHSVYFNRFYSTPVCSPTRATLLTGRSNLRHCIKSALPCDHMEHGTWECMQSTTPLPHSEFTIAKAVRKSGKDYATMQVGKWHLGDLFDKAQTGWKDNGRRSKTWPVSSPGDAGFEHWHSTQSQAVTSTPNCGCFDAPADWQPLPGGLPEQVQNSTSGCAKFKFFPGSNCVVGGGMYVNYSNPCQNYWSPDLSSPIAVTNLTLKSPEDIPADDNTYIIDKFEAFAKEAKAAGRPFLAYLPIHSIHLPHPALPEFYNMYTQDQDPDYAGILTQMDVQIGRLRRFLKDEGLSDNTLLWFTSDNGPHCNGAFQDVCGGVGKGRSTAGLRGCKASIWEGGIRVPGIVEWPAVIKQHVDSPVAGSSLDILPTILDVLGIEVDNPDWPLDGQSLLSVFEGSQKPRQPFGVALGGTGAWFDNEMKLAFSPGPGQGCVVEPPYSASDAKGPFLYNLTSDPTESVDLTSALPDVHQKMLTAWNDWHASIATSTTSENQCAHQHGPTPTPTPTPTPSPPTPSPTSQCVFTEGMGGCGGDLRKVTKADKEACCHECLQSDDCSVAVFDPQGICHIKSLAKPCYAKEGYFLCNVTETRARSAVV